jgi:hypothetical protein
LLVTFLFLQSLINDAHAWKDRKRGLQLGQNLGRGAGLSSSLLIIELIIRRDHPLLSGNGVGFKWSTLEKSPNNVGDLDSEVQNPGT